MLNLYELAVAALPAEHIDHHASDLYLKATPESKRLLEAWIMDNGYKTLAACGLLSKFYCQLDGCFWYDIAFQYTPYWEACARRHAQQ